MSLNPNGVAQWLKDQAIRMRRTNWTSPDLLAEELFTIFTRVPYTGTGPIQIAPISGQGGSIIDLEPQESLNIPPYDLDFYDVTDLHNEPTRTVSTDAKGQKVVHNTIEHITRTTIPGKIGSGSGNEYSVFIYPAGIDGVDKSVTVKQLQINGSEVIPADTWTMVCRINKLIIVETLTEEENGRVIKSTAISVADSEGFPKHYMQVPVWIV